MRKAVIGICLLLLLTGQVFATVADAQADLFGVPMLVDALPEKVDSDTTLQSIFDRAVTGSTASLRTAGRMLLRIMLIVILCRLVETGEGEQISRACALGGALAVSVCCVSDLRGMIGLGRETVERIKAFSDLLLPVMASAAAASGACSASEVIYSLTVLFSDLLMGFLTKVLLPVIYAMVAVSIADCAMGETNLKRIAELLGWFLRFGLKGVMYLFTGFLTISGVLSGSTDAAALKAAKVTISGMIPVVGGIISDAAETVLASAGTLRSTIGTLGMLALVALFLAPFLQIGIHYLAMKLASALSGTLGSGLCRLLDSLTEAMGFLLAMTGSSVLMCMLSCICLIQVVRI